VNDVQVIATLFLEPLENLQSPLPRDLGLENCTDFPAAERVLPLSESVIQIVNGVESVEK